MQENELEKNIRNKMEEFALVPDAHVWTEVSKRIANNKRKRRIAYLWVLAAIMLVGGAGGYIFLSKENNTITSTNKFSLNKTSEKPGTIEEQPTQELKDEQKIAGEKKETEQIKDVFAKEQASPFSEKQLTTAKILERSAEKDTDESPLKRQKTTNDISKEILNSKAPVAKSAIKKTGKAGEDLPLHSYYGIDKKSVTFKDSLSRPVVAEAKPGKTKTPIKQPRKTWTAGFTVSAGVSNNRTNFPLLSSAVNDQSYSSPTQSNGGSVSNASIKSLSYNTNFSFSLGGYVQKRLYKRLGMSLGLNYHYFSANSTVGNLVNSPATINDSVLQTTKTIDSYYINGTSTHYKNSYHFLQLPIQLTYQLNRNEQKPVVLTAGITPGFLVGSNALYANRSRRMYYREKKQFSNVQVFAEVGLTIPIIGLKKFHVSAGPTLQYGINNLTKGVTGTNQHLFFTGLKTNIALK